MITRWALVAFALLASPGASAADPSASDWAPSLKSQARLIADGDGQAGFEVRLAPGAITYWRDPGEAGVPPSFDFSGSVNLAKAEVQFPAPKRIAESDGSEAFGYEGGVVFPISVQAVDPQKPVILALSASYAVCEKICLPARAELSLSVPKGTASAFAADIAAARARIPAPRKPAALGVELTALSERSWRLCMPSSPDAARDLFVEPPPGWWLTAGAATSAPDRKCFALDLRETPADAKFPAEVRATIVGGAGAVETWVELAPKT